LGAQVRKEGIGVGRIGFSFRKVLEGNFLGKEGKVNSLEKGL